MISETPPLQPIIPAYHVNVLDIDQRTTLQDATLTVLEEIGIHVPSEKALHIYADHGALVNFTTQIVRLPRDVVLKYMAYAPRTYTMGARLPSHDLYLDGSRLYCATDGCGVETIDFNSRDRRTSRKQDVADTARLCDALSSIGFYWPMVSAQDFPNTAPLHELEASFNNTIKHIQSETVMGERLAKSAVEMATVVAGDASIMRNRPPLSLLVCAIAPLAQDRDGIESGLIFAEAGLPVGFMSMANTGSTAPATLAGTLVTADAEIISALVLIQMNTPGAAVFHSLMPGIMHPHTGGYLATAWEGTLLYAAGVELAHSWGVPTLAGVFGTDAMVPGWQSAGDAASSLLLCALCGAETGAGLGLLEACTLLYPEAVILDSDIYHRVRIEASGLEINAETLALDVIRNVGPRGNFLKHKHTRVNIRKRQFSKLSNPYPMEGRVPDPIELARREAAHILETHFPQPLEVHQQVELKRIVESA